MLTLVPSLVHARPSRKAVVVDVVVPPVTVVVVAAMHTPQLGGQTAVHSSSHVFDSVAHSGCLSTHVVVVDVELGSVVVDNAQLCSRM